MLIVIVPSVSSSEGGWNKSTLNSSSAYSPYKGLSAAILEASPLLIVINSY